MIIINNFVANVGTSAWWSINKAYGVGELTFAGSTEDSGYSKGKDLDESSVWGVVQNAFDQKLLRQDVDGIYLVLTSR